MASKVLGYLGLDHYENIFYMARILHQLGKKVLLVDHSESKSLQISIPLPKNLLYDKSVISYRGIDFTSQSMDEEGVSKYDFVMISYGFQPPNDDVNLCHHLKIVTDLHLHNSYRIQELFTNYYQSRNIKNSLLIRGIIDCKITPTMVANHIAQQIPFESVTTLYQDLLDEKNALLCQYDLTFKFTKITNQLKINIMNEIILYYPELGKQVLKRAYKKSRRGD